MSLISKLLYTRPRLEQVLSALDKSRLRLPVVNVRLLFDDFDTMPVTLRELPIGPWSSPTADVVMLAKIVSCLRPKRVLEVGSYRGYTTKILAEHTPQDSRVIALDRDPRHGEAYRGSALAPKIERRVGKVSEEAFSHDQRGSFDVIFLDADHTYGAVLHDSRVLLPLLAPSGVFLWHDYANWGRFSRKNGVPEALHELSRAHPIVAVGGSWLAMHMPWWSTPQGAARVSAAAQDGLEPPAGSDVWTVTMLR